jgi:hypothetical protein
MPFTPAQRKKLATGEEITLNPKTLAKKTKKKMHVIWVTHAQDRMIQEAIKLNRPFKLRFSPIQRDFNAIWGRGFFVEICGMVLSLRPVQFIRGFRKWQLHQSDKQF